MQFDLTLYLVTDSSYHTEEEFLARVSAACRGGVTMVQLREKEKSGREYLLLAKKVKDITDRFGVPLIIDDRVDIAMAIDAAGVHVGQSDIPVEYARKLLGPDKIVGATAKTLEQAKAAFDAGADYLGVGAMYPTTTKVVTILTPPEMIGKIKASVPLPVVAIGGLNAENVDILNAQPIDGVAMVRALMCAENPEKAAEECKKAVIKIKEGNR